jgi:hypothetical protein
MTCCGCEGKALRLTFKEGCPDAVLRLVRCLDRSVKATPTERYRLLTVMNQGSFRLEADRVFTVKPIPTASNRDFTALNRAVEAVEVV